MEGRKISADRSPSSLRQSLNNLQPMIHHIKDPPMTDSPKHDGDPFGGGDLIGGGSLSVGGPQTAAAAKISVFDVDSDRPGPI